MTETFVSIILIVIVVFAVVGVMQAILPRVEDLSDLPLTNHARNGHLGQTWTAEMIIGVMTRNECRPMIIYVCTNEIRYFCPDPNNPDNYLGLIVGKTSNLVITGWTARVEYWLSAVARDNCIPAAIP
ncbi:MAG: hypothetical protein D4R38_02645 [Dehalococcoidia bacterium]|nr:MAG: hypothetical protein D4R38_02645 [Dehalococcoidia bacterium]